MGGRLPGWIHNGKRCVKIKGRTIRCYRATLRDYKNRKKESKASLTSEAFFIFKIVNNMLN
jgi:hypothetical protein